MLNYECPLNGRILNQIEAYFYFDKEWTYLLNHLKTQSYLSLQMMCLVSCDL